MTTKGRIVAPLTRLQVIRGTSGITELLRHSSHCRRVIVGALSKAQLVVG